MLKVHDVHFVRYIVYIMPLDEYNRVQKKLCSMKSYNLEEGNIIVSYYFDSETEVPVESAKHSNAKSVVAHVYRPIAHSVKQTIKDTVRKEKHAAPRIITQQLPENEVFGESSIAESVRNSRQISNYKQAYASPVDKDTDDIKNIIMKIFLQAVDTDPDIADKNRPYLREVLIRHGKQMNVVCYLEGPVEDIGRFSCGTGQYFRALAIDTTFNIAEYYLTQSVFRHLAVLKRTDHQHPWFPGPIMAHREKSANDFSYFWQACKRGNEKLSNLRVLGTDEDEALIMGIDRETNDNMINLLGKEHVSKNIMKKPLSLNFPVRQAKIVIDDVFGSSFPQNRTENKKGLVECETLEDFELKVEVLKEKRRNFEKKFTRNDPPNKFVIYFEEYKEKSIRDKMTKFVLAQANEVSVSQT